MRSQHRQSDADDRLLKMVAAILLLAVCFWLYKQYARSQAPPPVAASAPQAYVPQIETPHPETWGNTDGDALPPAQAEDIPAAPDTLTPNQQAQLRLQEEQQKLAQALAASNPQPGAYVVQPSAEAIRQARCQAAKDHRDAVLRQVGLNRTFDLLRQLDEQVYEACKAG